MCNCPNMRFGRDFVYLMKAMTHSSQMEDIDNFIASIPENVSILAMSQCTVHRWVEATSLELYERTGVTNNRYICQNAEGTIVLTPEGCEFVKDCMDKQAEGRETSGISPTRALREFRVHYPDRRYRL
ncbi:hypothetical protein EVC24_039 [Rhizobium phage RHph_I4]|nr:hypothetical protein EVC24_039 [Rhizobium phage RHph_I4]